MIAPLDRGLNYGDGLFETIAVFSARPCLWQRHVDRLRQSCRRMGIPAPPVDRLRKDLDLLLSQLGSAESDRWVWKILLTRGSAGRGYRPDPDSVPLRISTLHDWPSAAGASGLIVRTCQTRLGQNQSLAGMKHLCRLEQVLARREWSDPAIDEGLMLDGLGQVIEATSSNLFLQHGRNLVTPSLEYAGVAGVVRGLIIDLAAQQDLPVGIRSVEASDLRAADGLYLCNSVIGVRRIMRWESKEYDLGLPVPAPIAAAMEQVHSPC